MLDLFGREYVIDHCVAALKAERQEQNKVMYITDVMRLTLDAVARLGNGNVNIPRYADIIKPPKEEKRTPDEIIDHMKAKIRALG